MSVVVKIKYRLGMNLNLQSKHSKIPNNLLKAKSNALYSPSKDSLGDEFTEYNKKFKS